MLKCGKARKTLIANPGTRRGMAAPGALALTGAHDENKYEYQEPISSDFMKGWGSKKIPCRFRGLKD
jgi:hypothetical protein